MPILFAELTAPQFKSLPREQTVFFFPVGGFEDHGPHLPLSLDLDEALDQCQRLGARIEVDRPGWRSVIMPSIPFAVDPVTTGVAFPIRAHVLRDWLIDASRALKRNGFVHAVCFSGSRGPRQLTTIEEAGKSLTRMGRLRRLFTRAPSQGGMAFASLTSGLTSAADLKHSAWWPAPSEHGGSRDTSIAMALGRLKPTQPPAPPLPADHAPLKRGMMRILSVGAARMRGTISGYWGNPAAASADHGARLLADDADALYTRLTALLDGASADKLFRSWYSVLPGNGSFFRAWVLLLLFLMSLVLWAQWLTSGISSG